LLSPTKTINWNQSSIGRLLERVVKYRLVGLYGVKSRFPDVFAPDRRSKNILPAPFSLSNPNDSAFNNTLLKEIEPAAA
jgi:hypothetical protein